MENTSFLTMTNTTELLFTVDESNNPLDPKPRKEVHTNGYWHRTTQIVILNKKKQILCQRRSVTKDVNPGKWEYFFGGHVLAEQSYEDNAGEELKEELGITALPKDFHLIKIYKITVGKEFRGAFSFAWNGSIDSLTLQEDEVDQVKWVNISELQKLLIKDKVYEWNTTEYDSELMQKLEEVGA